MNILYWVASISLVFAVPNPVLPGIADAGVLRYAGTYYLMGVGTHGDVYTSKDLVHWVPAGHAFSMDNAWATGPASADSEIHACDLMLRNGVFHLYWSVNHGELRQIGHATADTPLGPYHEPVRETPFDGRIDPQCFQDEDGRLYFYTVKFSRGNVIWGQPMTGPWALAETPTRMLWALQDTWECLDLSGEKTPIQVNEGPFAAKYRGRYYLLYNANHTAPRYGHYALGAAEADTPLTFSNEGKYGFPVLRSNRDPGYVGLLPPDNVPEVKNCGQPNLLRGPNGVEWWLIYFADCGRRSQCIDRVHFFGRELYVEGPTSVSESGYHPLPAMPSFLDLFEEEEPTASRWKLDGAWRKEGGALRVPAGAVAACACPQRAPVRNYLIETTLRYRGEAAGNLGVIAWENARGANARIGLKREKNAVFFSLYGRGAGMEQQMALPGDFNWNGQHVLRVENNEGDLEILLDGIRYPLPEAHIPDYESGTAGLFAEGCGADVESFALTRGWDEWGHAVTGWADPSGKSADVDANGVYLEADASIFKGELLPQYEFAVQFSGKGEGGLYPVYVDEENFLQVSVDADFTQLRATGKRQGQALPERLFAIRPRLHRVHPVSENGNNLRAVKLKERVILFAEGLELGEIEGAWPDSRVGLFAKDGRCSFDGITVYELP